MNDPVPSAIHELVDDPEKLARLLRLHKDTVSEPRRSQIDQGLRWLFSRIIDNWHLVQGPDIALWRHHETVYAWCDSSDRLIEGKPVWAYEPLFAAVPVDDFEAEVARFQTRLLDAMETRIDAIELGGEQPATVRIDVAELRTQHANEVETANRHHTIHPVTDWQAAAAALRTL